MKELCYSIEELIDVAQMAPGDPRRDHLGTCPRCRARLQSYHDFMSVDPLPAEGLAALAAARLDEALEGEIWGRPQEKARRSAHRAERSTSPFDWLRGPWRSLLPRPAWMVVGVALAALIVVVVSRQQPLSRHPGTTLRGEVHVGAGSLQAERRVLETGGVQFTWQRVEGADRYEVAFFAADLVEIARTEAGQATSVTLSNPPGADSRGDRGARYWCIRAFRGEEELARSTIQSLPRPE